MNQQIRLSGIVSRAALRRQIADWQDELDALKEQLDARGAAADSLEYNLKATEALRLALCINDLADLLIESA